MKKMKCEICEGTVFSKQGDSFVCQGCGTTYGAEDAKKLIFDDGMAAPEADNAISSESKSINNRFVLAKSSFESKNYEKAEEFCNEILSTDSSLYEAWKLKGDAIYLQTNSTNARILEVYNCYMGAFRTITQDDPHAEQKKQEIITSIENTFATWVSLGIDNFENNRPTVQNKLDVFNRFKQCRDNLISAFEEIGYDGAEYVRRITQDFVERINTACMNSWKIYVGYNYYRDDFNNLGSNWCREYGVKKKTGLTQVYRPSEDTRKTFFEETAVLHSMLTMCSGEFGNVDEHVVPLELQETIVSNMVFFAEQLVDTISYNSYENYTMNEYGVKQYTDYFYTIVDKIVHNAEAQSRLDLHKAQLTTIRMLLSFERRDKYWEEHSEEKQRLTKERNELSEKITSITKEIESINNAPAVIALKEQIDNLTKEQQSLSIFKGKQKKEIAAKIKTLQADLANATSKIGLLETEKEKLLKRDAEIRNEFVKER